MLTDAAASPAFDLGSYRLEEQIGFYLRRAGQRHASIFASHMVEDLTPTQWAALFKVAERQSISQNLLGRETAMDAATIKGVVDRLIRRGLVATRPDPGDARRTLIAITAAGRTAVQQGLGPAARITEETLQPLSAADRLTLLELLRKIG